MKKTFAILLACIMLIASVPFSASAAPIGNKTVAAGETWEIGEDTFITERLENNGKIVIKAGCSLTFTGNNAQLVNNGTVEVRNDARIHFAGKGKGLNSTLINNENGSIVFYANSTGYFEKGSEGINDGNITNITNMDVVGTLMHKVSVPGSFYEDYDYRLTWNRKPITVFFEVSYFMYEEGDTDDAYTDIANYTLCPTDTSVYVYHGDKIFIMVTPKHNPDKTKSGNWVDPARMNLFAGTTKIDVTTVIPTGSELASNENPEYAGVYSFTPSNAVAVEFGAKDYKDIVKIFDITLPRTEAYYVITDNNDVDRVDVEFGKTLSFRVVLEPDYDKSDVYVYVNSLYQEPAEYGYYRIAGPFTSDGFATDGGVQNDLTITVMGITSNESQEQLGGFVSMIQEIVALIQEIFSYFSDLFAGLFGGSEAA